jgi:hypothetical protein
MDPRHYRNGPLRVKGIAIRIAELIPAIMIARRRQEMAAIGLKGKWSRIVDPHLVSYMDVRQAGWKKSARQTGEPSIYAESQNLTVDAEDSQQVAHRGPARHGKLRP